MAVYVRGLTQGAHWVQLPFPPPPLLPSPPSWPQQAHLRWVSAKQVCSSQVDRSSRKRPRDGGRGGEGDVKRMEVCYIHAPVLHKECHCDGLIKLKLKMRKKVRWELRQSSVDVTGKAPRGPRDRHQAAASVVLCLKGHQWHREVVSVKEKKDLTFLRKCDHRRGQVRPLGLGPVLSWVRSRRKPWASEGRGLPATRPLQSPALFPPCSWPRSLPSLPAYSCAHLRLRTQGFLYFFLFDPLF